MYCQGFNRILSQVLGVGLVLSTAQAAVSREQFPGRLRTELTSREIVREALDEQKYPIFMKFIKSVNVSERIYVTDPRNSSWIKTSHYFDPSAEMWDRFFRAAAQEYLTCLRAFALLAREIKKNGVVVFGSGEVFEAAVKKNHIDLGLALPARNIGAAVWSPDPSNKDPDFLVHMKVFYTQSYVHRFPDEVLPANLKIGLNPEESYWIEGKEIRNHAVDADIYYGPAHGVGFSNVKGVGGQKRGIMGVFQKIFFFLPDAIHSMTIHEDSGEMVTEALVNTTVKNFETNPIYSIKVNAL